MAKKPGSPVRGSTTGKPLMVLLDIFGQRWTLRIMWELRNGALTFRQLQSQCGDISPTVLNRRLKEMRALNLLDHLGDGYSLSSWGKKFGKQLAALEKQAVDWSAHLPTQSKSPF